MEDQRYVIIGDVHGCLEELDDLLAHVQYRGRNGGDRLVFAGDLLDRGPDPVGVVRRARELRAECVMGNHEEKHVRWRRWTGKVASGEAAKNPMRPFDKVRLDEHNALSEEDMAYIVAMPKFIRLNEGWLVVHAGFESNGVAVETQKLNTVSRVRDVNEKGKMAVNKADFFKPAEGSVPWSTRWAGPENVVYGHAVHSLAKPRVDNHEDYACYGIDTGCVFGGALTALVVDPRGVKYPTFKNIRSKREYYPLPRGWGPGRPLAAD